MKNPDVKEKALNKVREMTGVKPGRGSAGRSDAAARGRGRWKDGGLNLAEIDRACNAFLKERVPGYRIAAFGGWVQAKRCN